MISTFHRNKNIEGSLSYEHVDYIPSRAEMLPIYYGTVMRK